MKHAVLLSSLCWVAVGESLTLLSYIGLPVISLIGEIAYGNTSFLNPLHQVPWIGDGLYNISELVVNVIQFVISLFFGRADFLNPMRLQAGFPTSSMLIVFGLSTTLVVPLMSRIVGRQELMKALFLGPIYAVAIIATVLLILEGSFGIMGFVAPLIPASWAFPLLIVGTLFVAPIFIYFEIYGLAYGILSLLTFLFITVSSIAIFWLVDLVYAGVGIAFPQLVWNSGVWSDVILTSIGCALIGGVVGAFSEHYKKGSVAISVGLGLCAVFVGAGLLAYAWPNPTALLIGVFLTFFGGVFDSYLFYKYTSRWN